MLNFHFYVNWIREPDSISRDFLSLPEQWHYLSLSGTHRLGPGKKRIFFCPKYSVRRQTWSSNKKMLICEERNQRCSFLPELEREIRPRKSKKMDYDSPWDAFRGWCCLFGMMHWGAAPTFRAVRCANSARTKFGIGNWRWLSLLTCHVLGHRDD